MIAIVLPLLSDSAAYSESPNGDEPFASATARPGLLPGTHLEAGA